MIVGLGTDICQVDRIARSYERFGDRFVDRILNVAERSDWEKLPDIGRARFLARRFAAKEAAVKALGTGAREGVALNQVIVGHDSLGKPELAFCDAAKHRARVLDAVTVWVSISDERDYAIAVVVLSA